MRRARITLRTADPSHAKRLHAMITANLEEGHLLPRTLGELTVHAERFTIALRGKTIVGCAELAPLSPTVAEVRSLAVSPLVRGTGVGTQIVEELRRRARLESFEKLCALTHTPAYFIQMGVWIGPHRWLHEKVFAERVGCPKFRTCGECAMVVPVESEFDAVHDRPAAARYA